MVKCVRLVVTHHQVDSRRLTLQPASDNRWDQHFARRGEAASHPPVHTTSDIPPDTFSAFVFLFQCDSDLCRIIVSSHPQIDPYASAADPLNQKVEGTAWRSKPSWYIVATKDRTVQPELQRFLARRMGAITVETASSHVNSDHCVIGPDGGWRCQAPAVLSLPERFRYYRELSPGVASDWADSDGPSASTPPIEPRGAAGATRSRRPGAAGGRNGEPSQL